VSIYALMSGECLAPGLEQEKMLLERCRLLSGLLVRTYEMSMVSRDLSAQLLTLLRVLFVCNE